MKTENTRLPYEAPRLEVQELLPQAYATLVCPSGQHLTPDDHDSCAV